MTAQCGAAPLPNRTSLSSTTLNSTVQLSVALRCFGARDYGNHQHFCTKYHLLRCCKAKDHGHHRCALADLLRLISTIFWLFVAASGPVCGVHDAWVGRCVCVHAAGGWTQETAVPAGSACSFTSSACALRCPLHQTTTTVATRTWPCSPTMTRARWTTIQPTPMQTLTGTSGE